MPTFADISPRFWIFAAFLALVFLMGGGSRDDVTSLVILRPACAFFAAYALTVGGAGDFARVRAPLLLLAALGLWMIVQLIPLPPEVWGGLPGRAAIRELDHVLGLGDVWRPISLSPSKTMNSLCSLIVPVAGLLLYAVQPSADRRRILGLLMLVAAVSALMGVGQIAMGGTGPLYLYTVANFGSPVGLFANRNHDAVFLASMFVIAASLLAEHARLAHRSDPSTKPILIAGTCLLVMVILLFSGSRSGLLIGMLSIAGAIALYLAARRADRDDDQPVTGIRRYWLIGVLAVAVAAVYYLATHSSSFDRLATQSAAEDIRIHVLPQIAAMARENWLLGTGFGSFEYVYRAHESSEWLNQTYLNNAHDDWLQWVIEGGLPAILIFAGFCLWLGRTAFGYWREAENNPPLFRLVAMALGILVLLLIASALDYPLRVPSMMLYAVLMVALIADPPQPAAKVAKRKRSRTMDGSRQKSASWQKGAVQ